MNKMNGKDMKDLFKRATKLLASLSISHYEAYPYEFFISIQFSSK